jgi:PAS domain-containing protein
MKTIAATNPADFTLAVRINPGSAYEWSNVLLARASPDGLFELLTAAWERLLGYGRREFSGKTLRQLMKPGEPADAVAAILDHENMAPVDLTLRCRDGRPKHLRLHRRFDGFGDRMFIVAEETSPMCASAQMPRSMMGSVDA